MTDPKPLASLSSSLLARKGTASPAMRPHMSSIDYSPREADLIDSGPKDATDDLGWNDMGAEVESAPASAHESTVLPLDPDLSGAPEIPQAVPVVHEQLATIAAKFSTGTRQVPQPRSAVDHKRLAAFTLRIDGERHLKLRMACTVQARSAQQLLIHALDRLLEDCPEAVNLAAQVGNGQIGNRK